MLNLVCLEWSVYAAATDDKPGFAVVQVAEGFGIEGVSFTSARPGASEGRVVANIGQNSEPASQLVEGHRG